MFAKRPDINEVFTPRREDVNHKTYVKRLDYENDLKRALNGSLHPILFGYSGTGKSWLFKKVLGELNAKWEVVSCSNARSLGSLTDEINRVLDPHPKKELSSISTEISAEASTVIAKGGGKSTRKYDMVSARDPLLTSLERFRKRTGRSTAVLVLDNLEFILDSRKLLDELANLIILLSDDNRYTIYKIKLLIVGIPSNILDYFALEKHLEPIANRLQELRELRGFTLAQVGQFAEIGLVDLLKIKIEPRVLLGLKKHIYRVTLGIPQMVHEYCQRLAYELQDNQWKCETILQDNADLNWLRMGLRQSYTIVDSLVNKRESQVGRRNQVLYALCLTSSPSVDAKHIETILRQEFPLSTKGKRLGVSRILTQLSQANPTLLRPARRGAGLEFTDPRCRMCLRLVLKKDPQTEKVLKLCFAL